MASQAEEHSAGESDSQRYAYVRIETLSKRFGDFVAVEDVSLNIRRGEIFCLLGGSGCGKTTLLRMLAGFELPSAGRIIIDGVDMADVPPYERPVNMMFQSYALFPHMTVEQNVAFGLKQEGLPRTEIQARVTDMLGIVKLSGFERRKPHQLSGGQRQRVALARSLVKRPKLLLLDEPLGALDKKLREHTQFELVNIQQRLGVTFVVVTHDQEEAMTLASRIGVMSHGRIVQVGTPRDIYESPNSRLVADFIGNVNLFEGHLVYVAAEHRVVHSPELERPIHVGQGGGVPAGARVWVAIRPEKMQLTHERPAADHNCVQGEISDIAYMGDLSVYLLRLAAGKTLRVTRTNAAHAAERFAREERVWVHWPEAAGVVVTD